MKGGPVNRLEPHWPERSPPYPETLVDEGAWDATFEPWMERITRFMGDNPKVTLAAAAGLGLIVGWAIKRK